MKKWNILTLLLAVMPLSISAQEEETVICADRPGMATGTEVMPKGRWQWEQGFSYEADKTGGTTIHMLNFWNSVLRYGLTEKAELQVQFDGQYMHGDGMSVTGLCPIVTRTKVNIFEGQNALPSVGLLAQLTIPCGKEEFRSDNISPQLYALFSNDISDKFNLTYNVGLEWDGDDAAPTTMVALAAGYSPSDYVGVFVEGYGYMHRHTSAQWYTDAGVTWITSPRVQLDLSAGILLNKFAKDFFVAFGASFLL